MIMLCPLCHSKETNLLSHPHVPGEIYHCQNCDLIFKAPGLHLGWEDQKIRYDQHQNHIENPGYVEFFEQLMRPLRAYLKTGERALDWGSGPGENPVLAQLLASEGLVVDLYDPIYQPQIPSAAYDLVTSTEVFEHFIEPRTSLSVILQHVKSGGLLAGLTQFHQGPGKFANWWYVKDPTHVVFYSENTFQWMASNWELEILHLKTPVFIFRKF